VQALVIAASVLLACKLIYIQVLRHDFYMQLAAKYYPSNRPRAGQSGAILDREGRVLADSVTVASLKVAPRIARRMEDIPAMAQFIATTLKRDKKQILRILQSDADWAYLARGVDLQTAGKIMAAGFAGVTRDLEYRRTYPNGSLACHVIGVRSADYRPLEGLEYRYRFLLDGKPGTTVTNVDAFGRTIVGHEQQLSLPPLPGMDVVTTLDLTVQRFVEAELDRCMAKRRPKAATCVVMDCNTGEILALASRPNYDPNRIAGVPAGVTRVGVSPTSMLNLCVSRQHEPGSTFKPLVVAAALDAGVIKPTDRFLCKGTEMIGGKPLHCWGKWAVTGHGYLTPEQIIAKSCNLGAAHIALKLGADAYYKFLRKAGFGQVTRCGLMGEMAGQLQKPEQMRKRDLANIGFGQNVGVTDIQLVAAISAIVNGGLYHQPHIIKAVYNKDGSLYRKFEPPSPRRLCSEHTSKLIRKMLVAAVEHGTGHLARIKGACIGGKTGTAQIWDPKKREFSSYIMSFVLAAPMDTKPQFVILVTVQDPTIGEHGAEVAAPVAREIARSMLMRRGLLKRASSG